jgi:competence protein ComGC
MDEWLNTTKILLIIIILSILGLNIFNYLARGTDVIADTGKDAIGTLAEGTKQTIQMATTGAKTGVDVAGGTLESGLDVLEKTLDIHVSDGNSGSPPSPDNSNSSIQNPNKSGYCYIGTEKGFRSCVYVGKNDKCMSGDIFPSKDICINPKLRV